jgi:hypothetical protein
VSIFVMSPIRKVFSYLLAPTVLMCSLGTAGCSAEDGGPMFVQVDPPSTVIPSGNTDGTDGLSCEPFDLCSETIDRCEVNMTVEQCEWWYEDENNCADLDAYIECNCECLDEETCDDYFSCGQFCFDEFC